MIRRKHLIRIFFQHNIAVSLLLAFFHYSPTRLVHAISVSSTGAAKIFGVITVDQQTKFGALKLCPPGGRSFFEAFQIACPMRRKKRSTNSFGKGAYRPATISEIMLICCSQGCEFKDLLPYCSPFSD